MRFLSAQRGNILFLILLAVVLFAALAYAVTSSMRGGGKDAGNEKTEAKVSQMLNYFAELNAGIQRMMLVNDVKDYQINFYYQSSSTYVMGGNDNPNCTESRCRVFDPAGGGVVGRLAMDFQRSDITGSGPYPRVFYISVPGVGSSAPDIVLKLHGITTPICRAINKKFGADEMLLQLGGIGASTLTTMYQNPIPAGPIPDNGVAITNLPFAAAQAGTFCGCDQATVAACEASSSLPAVFHVLVAR